MNFQMQASSEVQIAYVNGIAATKALAKAEQKRLGQYMTPPAIAHFMARRAVAELSGEVLRILDPAAGSGVLAAAAVEAVLERSALPKRIELLLFEIDVRLSSALHFLCTSLAERCHSRGVELDYLILNEDFLLSRLARERQPLVDLVIANPPYFKLSKSDPRATLHSYAVWGQPNIYGLFLAATSSLVRRGGRLCFITPRSWMSGAYFSSVRRHLLAHIRLDGLHVFDSRNAHFTEDEVLQEAVITWGTAKEVSESVLYSSSIGVKDLDSAALKTLPVRELVSEDADRVIRLPIRNGLRAAVASLSDSFASLGLRVSTGPVVAFRASEYLRSQAGANSVPLLWLQHVKGMSVVWPQQKKREHIAAAASNAWMLMPNAPMVLLRRFSPKEDMRRVTAAPYLGNLPGSAIGIENHLNYVCRPGGEMGRNEVVGLSAFLNSHWVSAYFEAMSGHTQVNAIDLRALPLPTRSVLERIGSVLSDNSDVEQADVAVGATLGWALSAPMHDMAQR